MVVFYDRVIRDFNVETKQGDMDVYIQLFCDDFSK